jgi:hypothetical protein
LAGAGINTGLSETEKVEGIGVHGSSGHEKYLSDLKLCIERP